MQAALRLLAGKAVLELTETALSKLKIRTGWLEPRELEQK